MNHLVGVSNGSGTTFVPVSEVMYCMAQGSYTSIYLRSGKVLTSSKGLKKVRESLPDSGFVRIHNSYLVGIDYIKEFQSGVKLCITMKDGQCFPISRRRKQALFAHYKLI